MENKKFLKAEDLKIIIDFFSTLPISVLWGLDATEKLANDEVAINVIATGISKSKE